MLHFLWDKIKKLAGASPSMMEGKRSSKWPTVRKQHLEKFDSCAACGRKENLEVHHVIPFSIDPHRELDADNLITLCEPTCHFLIGHLNSWTSYNRHVRDDAAFLRGRILGRP